MKSGSDHEKPNFPTKNSSRKIARAAAADNAAKRRARGVVWARAAHDRRKPSNDRRRNADRRDEAVRRHPGLACIPAIERISVKPVQLVTEEALRPGVPKGLFIDDLI